MVWDAIPRHWRADFLMFGQLGSQQPWVSRKRDLRIGTRMVLKVFCYYDLLCSGDRNILAEFFGAHQHDFSCGVLFTELNFSCSFTFVGFS